MRHKHYITAMTEYWALMPEHAHAYLELVVKHFNSADVTNLERPKDFSVGIIGAGAFGKGAVPYFISEFGSAAPVAEAPENSISVIALNNIITKYDGWCHAGIETKASMLLEADANPNIIGHIIVFDTPGGEARAPEKMGQAIQACTKPVYGYIDNLCASAGYWIASYCEKIFIAGNMAQVGSIGAYTTIIDHTERLKQMGINLIEIYADQSTNKNIEFREALAGKPEKMRARLTELQTYFESSVRSRRNEVITDQSVYSGSVLMGPKAIEAGLVDGMATFAEVVAMVEAEAEKLDLINTTTYY